MFIVLLNVTSVTTTGVVVLWRVGELSVTLAVPLWVCVCSIYSGHHSLLIPPAEVEQNPALWLTTVSQYKGLLWSVECRMNFHLENLEKVGMLGKMCSSLRISWFRHFTWLRMQQTVDICVLWYTQQHTSRSYLWSNCPCAKSLIAHFPMLHLVVLSL